MIGALVVRRPLLRRRARSSILFSSGLRVFCGAGGLVGSRRNVGALLDAVSAVPLSGRVTEVVSVTSSSSTVVLDGDKVDPLFLGRKKGLLREFSAGRLLGNKSDNFDGLKRLLDLPRPPIVGLTSFVVGSKVVASSVSGVVSIESNDSNCSLNESNCSVGVTFSSSFTSLIGAAFVGLMSNVVLLA